MHMAMKTKAILLALGMLFTVRVSAQTLEQAQTYDKAYRFEEAVATYDAFIARQTKRRRPIGNAEALLEKSKANLRMLKGVEEVCVIDSVVVDKKSFLDVYKISPESGALFAYNAFFPDSTAQDGIVYETEIGDRIYYGETTDGKESIFTNTKLQDEWGRERRLPAIINDSVNAGYPFMMTDGMTIYYAADGAAGLGGYDIFVTRYDINSDTYLTPENVGMPFNSPYNDYMYVVDEYYDLGWFASDRYQPEGKVCVYIFVPNASKRVYNYETTDKEKLARLAQITSLKETWSDAAVVKAAQARLLAVRTAKPVTKQVHDFEFVIDDRHTYYIINDFKSAEAKQLFAAYRELAKRLTTQDEKLQSMRDRYADADADAKTKMAPAILDLEKQVEILYVETERAAVNARNKEKLTLNK
jgi:hypothetical protein